LLGDDFAADPGGFARSLSDILLDGLVIIPDAEPAPGSSTDSSSAASWFADPPPTTDGSRSSRSLTRAVRRFQAIRNRSRARMMRQPAKV
jgi:hypothetical protein